MHVILSKINNMQTEYSEVEKNNTDNAAMIGKVLGAMTDCNSS